MQTATKIGLVVEGTTVPFWVAEAIRDLLFSGEAEFPLVVQLSSADPNSDTQRANICNPASGYQPVGWNYAAYRGYQNLDARLKKREPAYDTPVPLKEVLPDTDDYLLKAKQIYPICRPSNQQSSISCLTPVRFYPTRT